MSEIIKNNEIIEEQPKGYYKVVNEYYKEVDNIQMIDDVETVVGKKKIITGRDVEWVWTDEEELKKQRRNERKPLLDAFDKWEKAVLRGRELDDEKVMTWYQLLLDLEETAFESIPPRVRYYLKNIDEEN